MGIPMGIPVGMGWVWGLKCHPHGSPVVLLNLSLFAQVQKNKKTQFIVSYSLKKKAVETVSVLLMCKLFYC